MAQPGLRLRHIVFHGPNRPPAALDFGPGLNVIYGASECGKSFVVEAIDFMLGGKQHLRDIPERVGYDRILMGLETLAGEQFTLLRSVDGGAFRAFSGLHVQPPAEGVEAVELADQHSEKNYVNLSMYLLQRCAMDGKRVRKNKQGETNSLSFRNLARLLIVDETEIIAQRSPLSDGNPTADTPNFATFKLLLTGVDDVALVPNKPKGPEDQSKEAQLELLDQLIDEHRERLAELTKDPDDLEDQLQRLEGSLSQHENQLATTDAEYRGLEVRRRDTRKKLEEGRDRRAEIAGLLERFTLLDRHYVSDVARLRGIEEGGTLFEVMGQAPCPLCGAEPAHHRRDSDCDGNIEAVVAAARSEIAKIELLRTELADTVTSLEREGDGFDKRLPRVDEDLRKLSLGIEQLITPKLTRLRTTYAGLADKRGEVREALAIYKSIKDVEARRLKIENDGDDQKDGAVSEGDLSAAVADAFALQVEAVLKDWHFPEAERVFFDAKSRDLVIAGKPRTARGKGLRAITHAAFTVGLLQFCKTKDTPHPGFVILDTPLRAYREPEGSEEDLTGTDLNVKFYDYLAGLADDRQVIIVENTDPPSTITTRPQVVMFSKNPHSGRYGFFPMAAEQKKLPPAESS
ncbi:MAG TPA: AAA family ATPase [Terriglobales bacterium]|nr:AAA family ATPase [Terriglobales bacterium]